MAPAIKKRHMGVKGLLAFIVGALLLSTAQAAVESGTTVLSNATADQQATPEQPAAAEQPAMKIYKYTSRSGVRSYSDRAPVGGIAYEVMQFSCYACNPKSTVDWNNIPLQLSAFDYAINASAKKYRVDPALVRAVIHAESAFRPGARSNKGALGLMQLMPDTAKDMGVVNVMSPDENIQGGVKYLAMLLDQNRGNTMLATAAYNAGPGAVKRYNGIPPFAETQTYVKRVKLLHDRYKKALNKTFSGRYVSQVDKY